MRRGTNPLLTFELPEPITISALFITFRQDERNVLEKSLNDVTYDKGNRALSACRLRRLIPWFLMQVSRCGCSSGCVTIWITPP